MENKRYARVYGWLVTLPDRLYPFKSEVDGSWVRGVRSYNATFAHYQELYGEGHYGFKLDAYRQIFHLAGSILFLTLAAYVSHSLLRSDQALPVFLLVAVLFISFQEFYLHRRMYQQLWKKGLLDWLSWCVPLGIYFFMHFR